MGGGGVADFSVVPVRYADEQRLAFGRVAQLYDRVRPSYPQEVIDAVLDRSAPRWRSDPGGRGRDGESHDVVRRARSAVVALEPDHAMARVARANCTRHPGVEIIERDFERWPVRELFSAIISAAAWNWVAPEVRYVKAQQALGAGWDARSDVDVAGLGALPAHSVAERRVPGDRAGAGARVPDAPR